VLLPSSQCLRGTLSFVIVRELPVQILSTRCTQGARVTSNLSCVAMQKQRKALCQALPGVTHVHYLLQARGNVKT
jgi:hypothetical protein